MFLLWVTPGWAKITYKNVKYHAAEHPEPGALWAKGRLKQHVYKPL
jgi:hypothetical protein